MVVQIVNENGVLALESERHPPIGVDANRPMVAKATSERMKVPPRPVHVFRPSGAIQSRQKTSQSWRMPGINSGPAAG